MNDTEEEATTSEPSAIVVDWRLNGWAALVVTIITVGFAFLIHDVDYQRAATWCLALLGGGALAFGVFIPLLRIAKVSFERRIAIAHIGALFANALLVSLQQVANAWIVAATIPAQGVWLAISLLALWRRHRLLSDPEFRARAEERREYRRRAFERGENVREALRIGVAVYFGAFLVIGGLVLLNDRATAGKLDLPPGVEHFVAQIAGSDWLSVLILAPLVQTFFTVSATRVILAMGGRSVFLLSLAHVFSVVFYGMIVGDGEKMSVPIPVTVQLILFYLHMRYFRPNIVVEE